MTCDNRAYEYKVEWAGSQMMDVQAMLNRYAEQGWRLVGMSGRMVVLERTKS